MIKRQKMDVPGVSSCSGCVYKGSSSSPGCKNPKREKFPVVNLGISELYAHLGCLELINGKIINYIFIKMNNINSNIEIL